MIKGEFDINSNDNSLFVTSQCDNHCLMCSQPPLKRDDIDFHFERNIKILDKAPKGLTEIGITGGEPTLLGSQLLQLIDIIKVKLPNIQTIHILSNGRCFKDKGFVRELKAVGENKLLLGVPLHSDYEHDHDYIAQAMGSFNQTMNGLYHLAEYNINVELRIVINKINYERLFHLSRFIYKNLPFVKYVSFMGMEETGYVIKNRDIVWIDPDKYTSYLEKAVLNLATWTMDVAIFNLPFCCIPETLYEFAHKSISDWKVKFLKECDTCLLKHECCGLFSTSQNVYRVNALK